MASRRAFVRSRYASLSISRGFRGNARNSQRGVNTKLTPYSFGDQRTVSSTGQTTRFDQSFAEKGAFSSSVARRSQARLALHSQRSLFRSQGTNTKSVSELLPTTGSLAAVFPLLTRAQFALRLRTTCLPRIVSTQYVNDFRSVKPSSALLRPFRRRRRRRLIHARRRKAERRRKLPRLQPVHRVTPSYLQRDLRTLRATRVHAPASEEAHYAFAGSISRLIAFYRSRGLLN